MSNVLFAAAVAFGLCACGCTGAAVGAASDASTPDDGAGPGPGVDAAGDASNGGDGAAPDAAGDAKAAATRPRGPPLYWTPYEYDYVHDDYIPESVWQANLDWLAATFQSLGYDTVVSDGWIYGDSAVNTDGYITKYNNAWAHDFAYWQAYCAARGIRLGVYYNPLWIQASAFEANPRVVGTSYDLRSVTGAKRGAKPYDKYWIDPSKPGAKEYVQGYVAYFRSIGVTLLRLDFLSEFEATYGTPAYDQALAWIREAAGDDMFLSLVMPNGHDMAKTEVKYGDMMRVSEDTFGGGWGALSDRGRGTLHPDWPVAENAFDGFTHSAPISGRGQMILDGDAIRLNTFATSAERKTCISLYTIAGSPIPIADRVDTIGDAKGFFQNQELVALTKTWFVGKPLDAAVDSPDSQRWAGQTESGAWVVALFNRETSLGRRSVDFVGDLGLDSAAPTRDLWAHADLGALASYAVNLDPHDSAVLQIAPSRLKFEAEVGALGGGAKVNRDHAGHSAFGFVDTLNPGARVRFFVASPSAATRHLTVGYGNGSVLVKSASLHVNGAKRASFTLPTLASWDAWSTVALDVALDPGSNEIDVSIDPGDSGGFNLDYLRVD